MCGSKCLFPELLQYSLGLPFPLDAMLDDSSTSLSLRTTLHGGRGEGRIWPKERLFPCEKLIDGRGSAFCKLVPHNFGQDCLNVEIKHKSACNFQIIQRMDVKFDMVNVRDQHNFGQDCSLAAFAGVIDESFTRAMNWIVTVFAWHGQNLFVQVPASRCAISTMNRNWSNKSFSLSFFSRFTTIGNSWSCVDQFVLRIAKVPPRMLIIDNKWP